jgi:hypothetical protein
VFLLYDRMTGTVWYPLDDGSFDGVGGSRLGDRIPFVEKPPVMKLKEWRAIHPASLVLLGDQRHLAKEQAEPSAE